MLHLALRTGGPRRVLSPNNITNLRRRGYFTIQLCTADWKAGTDPRDYRVPRLDDDKAQAMLDCMKRAIHGPQGILAANPLRGFRYVAHKGKRDYRKVDWAPDDDETEILLPTLEALAFSDTDRQEWTERGAELGKKLINDTVKHPPTRRIPYYAGPKPEIPDHICQTRLGSGYTDDKGIPGVTDEYLYASLVAGSSSPAHQEDVWLFSVNRVELGSPKVWLMTGPEHEKALEALVERKLGVKRVDKDSQYVRHQDILFNTDFLGDEVEYFIVPQMETDIVVTLPMAYHEVVNSGPNVAMAVNFRLPEETEKALLGGFYKPITSYTFCDPAVCKAVDPITKDIYDASLADLIQPDPTNYRVTFARTWQYNNGTGSPSHCDDDRMAESEAVADHLMADEDDEEVASAERRIGGDNYVVDDHGSAKSTTHGSNTPAKATTRGSTLMPGLPSVMAMHMTPLTRHTISPTSPALSSQSADGSRYHIIELALSRAFPAPLVRDIMAVPEGMPAPFHPAVLARAFQLLYVSLFEDPISTPLPPLIEEAEADLVGLYRESLSPVSETPASKLYRLSSASSLWTMITGGVQERAVLRKEMAVAGLGKIKTEKYLLGQLEARARTDGLDAKELGNRLERFIHDAKVVGELGQLGVGLPVRQPVAPGPWFEEAFRNPKSRDVTKVRALGRDVVLQDYLDMTEPQRRLFAVWAGRRWGVRSGPARETASDVVSWLKRLAQ